MMTGWPITTSKNVRNDAERTQHTMRPASFDDPEAVMRMASAYAKRFTQSVTGKTPVVPNSKPNEQEQPKEADNENQ